MRQAIAIVCLATLTGSVSFAAGEADDLSLPPTPAVEENTFRSPVAFFRQLLAMSETERASALAPRSEHSRAMLLNKVAEYQALRPEIRELKLRTTELRWYLKTLLPMPEAQRAAKLKQMSPQDQELVAVRLEQWKLLSPGWRDEVLKHERTMDWIRQNRLAATAAAASTNAESRIAKWNQLPTETRAGMFRSFDRFFRLSETERERTLAVLPTGRRVTVTPALMKLNALPAEQQAECMTAFRKITAMPDAERQRFYRKAEQWRQMSATERETWINLVTKFPPMPPLPPGLRMRESQLPPLPSISRERKIVYPPLPPGLDLPTMPPLPLLTRK